MELTVERTGGVIVASGHKPVTVCLRYMVTPFVPDEHVQQYLRRAFIYSSLCNAPSMGWVERRFQGMLAISWNKLTALRPMETQAEAE